MNAHERLYVIAGTYREYLDWCADLPIGRNDPRVRCVLDSWALQGAPRGLWYIKIGTWERWSSRAHIDEMLYCCEARDADAAMGRMGSERRSAVNRLPSA